MSSKTKAGIFIGGLGFLFAFLLSCLSWFSSMEAYTWDWRVNSLADPSKASSEVCVILLDQKSLDWAQQEQEQSWPWPREYFSLILSYCKESGAKAVGFDVLFTNPSYVDSNDDKALADAIKSQERFVLPVEGKDKKDEKKFVWPTELEDKFILDISEGFRTYDHVDQPLKDFAENSKLLSHVNAFPDEDGVNRSALLLAKVGDKVLPSLGLGTYLAGNPGIKIERTKNGLLLGGKEIPLDKNGTALFQLRGPSKTHKTFNTASIIHSMVLIEEGEEPIVPKSELKDKYVLFGYSAAGLHDQHNVSIGGKYPGVEVHATVIDNILQNGFFKRVPLVFNYILAIALSIISALILLKASSHLKQGIFVLVLLVFPSLIAFGAASYGYKTELLLPAVSVASSLFLSVGFSYLTEGRQKRFIKHAFKHYLSSHVIEELIDNPDKLKLGGERREISIFFSDLQGFTTISEKLEPEVLIEVLNEYLSAMSDIILDESGTIDKYEGDAIIAFWNAPLNVKNHAFKCVDSALQCQKVLAEMNPRLKEKAGTDLKMRIGIHTGPAVVGNMGASERFDYTMLGDSVNLAARLEGVNKQFGTFTMISEETQKQMGDTYPVRELARVEVVGRKEPVTVYEPMLQEEYESKKADLEKFDQALRLFYEEKFQEALEIFEENSQNDPPSKHYANKCRNLIENDQKAPNGVWVMTSK